MTRDSQYKPTGYTSLSPYLIVDGAERTIDFLRTVFGAVDLRRISSEDGGLRHAEVRIDDTVLMLADSMEGWPPVPTHVHVYVPDVDAAYARALEAGAESVQEPMQKEDPDKRGGVKDAGGTTWWISTMLLALFCLLPGCVSAQDSELGQQVEIRRTTYGVPHIKAENLRAAGYAMAWVQLEDYGDKMPYMLYRTRGELALRFGKDSIDADFVNRRLWLRAVEVYPQLSKDTREVYEGFAAGINRYLTMHPSEFPDWMRPDFSGPDVLTTDMEWPSESMLRGYLRRVGAVTPRARTRQGEGPTPEEITNQFDVGSNAWALAPSRTTSGKAIMLRNPHLNWQSGYYEMQLTVDHDFTFYGDFRIGGPFQTIGGFNERLGFSTTNNAPDPDEIYLVDEDPARADHYLFDGASIPLQKEVTTRPYRTASGDTASESRERLTTHLGPVIYREGGKLHVWKVAGFTQFQLAEQWLAMMRARNFDSWYDAMRMLEKPSSNFTYADADGNIEYLWFGHQPKLKRPSGGDTVAVPAHTSDDVWTSLHPVEELPQLHNPPGGYIHQENDPFHFTNLNEILSPDIFADNYPRPNLRLRSQLAIELIGGTTKFSLEDVVRLKHSYKMLLADRVKTDLLSAVQAHAPSSTAKQAAALLAKWDNTASADSRGSVLFETWWNRYSSTATTPPSGDRDADIYADVWDVMRPTSTPRGLADPARAVEAFAWAITETARRYGAWDVAWGTVHRVRRGDVDAPVGGCSGALGCFRVLAYGEDPDGKLRANGGDGWVIAVEFGAVPRAYSILSYGESNNPASPYFADQAAMFARGEMKPVAFTEADIAAATVRRYRPGVK